MTKVLFLIPNLAHGGAEKVLVNLANNMDKTKFDVTVQTLFDVGVNRQYLNSDGRDPADGQRIIKTSSADSVNAPS